MSHRTNIEISKDLVEAWNAAQENKSLAYLEIGIDLANMTFVLVKAAEGDDPWKEILGALKEKSHQYFVIRDPLDVERKKYTLVHFGADLSPVKVRMIFASSRATLKGHLGGSHFAEDYFVSLNEELTLEAYTKRRTENDDIELRTDAEIERDEANMETVPQTVTSQVMKALPIEVSEGATTAAASHAGGDIAGVAFTLGAKKQEVEVSEEMKEASLEDIQKILPKDAPRYVVFKYPHKSPAGAETTKTGFIYYCPQEAPRSQKFTYSTCKVNVIGFLGQTGVEIDFKVEISEPKELNADALTATIYPSEATQKQIDLSARPTAPGGKKRSKRKKKKLLSCVDPDIDE